MSTTLPPNRTFRQRWTDFWFAPSDPTTLGFIRIVTGLLIIYIHLVYSLDLQAFFGKTGWYGAEYIRKERHEFPRVVESFTNWNENDALPRVPDFPHRRDSVMRFIRSLPEKQADRQRALQFLDRIAREDYNSTFQALNFLLEFHATGQHQEEKVYAALREGRQIYRYTRDGIWQYRDTEEPGRPTPEFIPLFLRNLKPDDRAAAAQDLRNFMAVLPENREDARYVLMHLMELDQPHRQALINFIITLPDDKAERDRLVDYLEYWNTDPRKVYRQGHAIVSVWFHVTDPTQMALIHSMALVIMVLFTAGFCTRVTGVLTWLAVVGYLHRTNQILFGMDTMMNILLIYLVIGNSGAALSIDRLIARYRAVRASLRRSGTIDEPTRAFLAQAPASSGANLGIRLIQVNFCFIYLAAGLSKLKGDAWWSGFAFWDVMINPEFTLLKYSWFESFVRELFGNELFGKPLYHIITTFGVWFTWGLEIAFPFLVWTRLRPVMLWMGVLLHASIGVFMGLNLFEMLMMTMLLVFFPPGVIRDRLRGGPGLPKLHFGFDPVDPKQERAAAAVAAVDVDSQVLFEPAKGKPAPVLVPAGGSAVPGSSGTSILFNNLRLLRPLRFGLFIPGVSALVSRIISPGTRPPAPPSGPSSPRTGPQAPAAAS
jgi:hypothetical protein